MCVYPLLVRRVEYEQTMHQFRLVIFYMGYFEVCLNGNNHGMFVVALHGEVHVLRFASLLGH